MPGPKWSVATPNVGRFVTATQDRLDKWFIRWSSSMTKVTNLVTYPQREESRSRGHFSVETPFLSRARSSRSSEGPGHGADSLATPLGTLFDS